MESRIVKSKAKCPKCKSNNLVLVELWKNHTIQFVQENGAVDRNNGSLEPGDAYKVEGRCDDCYHVWTFRKALQIDDVL